MTTSADLSLRMPGGPEDNGVPVSVGNFDVPVSVGVFTSVVDVGGP